MIKQFKKITLLVALLYIAGYASANDVYMEQIGSANTITITQEGAGNVVNSGGPASTSKAFVNTQGATISIDQIGSGNTLSLVLNNSNMASAGQGMNVTSYVDGSGNEQAISCGTALADSCNANTITQNLSGNNNKVTTTLSGGAASSIINLTGNYNQVTHTASGLGTHVASLDITGSGTAQANNLVSVTQSGALAKSVSVTSNGSNNNISITQSD